MQPRKQGQTQTQIQNQEQIISQNYANNILFMTLSTLETLHQKYYGNIGPKYFGSYDVIDYSYRTIPQLKEQLRLSLFQVLMSYQAQTSKNKNNYILPKNYNMNRVMHDL